MSQFLQGFNNKNVDRSVDVDFYKNEDSNNQIIDDQLHSDENIFHNVKQARIRNKSKSKPKRVREL